MGGLIVYVKKQFSRFITRISRRCEFGIFLKINKILLESGRDLVLACVYLPPENSPFYNEKSTKGIGMLEEAILEIDIENQYDLAIFGDFNSRTGIKSEVLNTELDIPQFHHDEGILDDADIIDRNSQDKVINSYGRKLIEFCICNSLYIINGRNHTDRYGEFTFITSTGCSVIDYLIVKKTMFKWIESFFVDNRTKSQHFQITFRLQFLNKNELNTTTKEANFIREKYVFNKKKYCTL